MCGHLKRCYASVFEERAAKWAVSVQVIAGTAAFVIAAGLGCARGPIPRDIDLGGPAETLEGTATRILGRAIRIETPNPPGDERPLAEYYVGLLRRAGIEARVIDTPTGASSVGRAAAWARLPGRGDLSPLVLLSHLDTVPVDRSAWLGDPHSGASVGGYVVGRGALDAKGVGVVQLLTLTELARRKISLGRDIIFLATPDEESGGVDGAGYIAKERSDLLGGARYLLTEGGGVLLGGKGRPEIWGIAITEKSPCWMRVSATGATGHGSVPPRGLDGAVPRLVAALDRLRDLEFPVEVIPEVAAMYRAMAPVSPGSDREGLAHLAEQLASDGGFRQRFLSRRSDAALVRTTLAITVLDGSARTNVLPGEAHAHLDVRVLPGKSCDRAVEQVRDAIGDAKVEIETLLSFPSRSSSAETPLFRAIEGVAKSREQGAIVLPRVIAGFTDSHFFRELGITAYGFVPRWFAPGEAYGAHGPNERISTENLARGVETLIAILKELDRIELRE